MGGLKPRGGAQLARRSDISTSTWRTALEVGASGKLIAGGRESPDLVGGGNFGTTRGLGWIWYDLRSEMF